MKKGRDAGFSSKRSGNAGSGAPLPDPVFRLVKSSAKIMRAFFSNYNQDTGAY